MAHYSVKPVEAVLLPSRLLAVLLLGMHAAAALLALSVPLDMPVRLVLLAAVAASLAYHGNREILRRSRNSVQAVHLAADGTFSIRFGSSWLQAEVQGSSFVRPWLTVLHLKPQGRRFGMPLVLLPDMLRTEDFRRLRVWLRWSGRSE